MSKIEQSIEVEVPVRTAYNQWTQFEEFPQFMEGVESVQQIDDTHLLWTAEIAGKTMGEALRLAVAAGAASTLEVGAGRFDPREVGRLAGGVEIEELHRLAAR